MTKLNQKAAVYQAIMNCLADNNISFDDGQDVKPHMTKELRAEVAQVLLAGFKAGTIEFEREPYETEGEMKAYVSGLISNWIKKDKRLNGNTKHQPKNPGSRAGATDDQVKALRALLTTVQTEAERAEIQEYLDKRLAEVKATKATVEVNVDALPEALRAKYAAN